MELLRVKVRLNRFNSKLQVWDQHEAKIIPFWQADSYPASSCSHVSHSQEQLLFFPGLCCWPLKTYMLLGMGSMPQSLLIFYRTEARFFSKGLRGTLVIFILVNLSALKTVGYCFHSCLRVICWWHLNILNSLQNKAKDSLPLEWGRILTSLKERN